MGCSAESCGNTSNAIRPYGIETVPSNRPNAGSTGYLNADVMDQARWLWSSIGTTKSNIV